MTYSGHRNWIPIIRYKSAISKAGLYERNISKVSTFSSKQR